MSAKDAALNKSLVALFVDNGLSGIWDTVEDTRASPPFGILWKDSYTPKREGGGSSRSAWLGSGTEITIRALSLLDQQQRSTEVNGRYLLVQIARFVVNLQWELCRVVHYLNS